jgi:hypothetical protein
MPVFGARFRTYFDKDNRTLIQSYDIDITAQNALSAGYYGVSTLSQVTGSFMLTPQANCFSRGHSSPLCDYQIT